MRFGVDVHFAVKDVEAVAAKKVGRRRPLSAPTTTTSTTAAFRTALKQPKKKIVSMQTEIKAIPLKQSNYMSLIEQYKPQFGRKQQQQQQQQSSSVGTSPSPVRAIRGTNKAVEEKEEVEKADSIEPEPMKLPSKYPIKNTSNINSLSNKTRIDPKTKWTAAEDSSSSSAGGGGAAMRWDDNVICEDRDLLLMAQDNKMSEYNLKHHHHHHLILLPPPEARLVPSDVRIALRDKDKDKRLGVGRERIEHYSVGKAINDPMPFYPFLHEGTGIHEVKWCRDMAVPNEEEIAHEQWSKPLLSLQNSKSRRSFHKQFRVPTSSASSSAAPITINPIPTSTIEVQHCLDRSIVSSYSKAALLDTGVKSSRQR